jgi:ABC-type nitrate/sulfonate/bicarbonate transport system permease component
MNHQTTGVLRSDRSEAGSPWRARQRRLALPSILPIARGIRSFALVFVLLGAWEAGVRGGFINGQLFPSPSMVARSLRELAELGVLWKDIGASVARITIGFAIATVVATVLAVILARSQRLARYVMPLVDLLRPISVIAWIPLAILWFGLGNKPAWFIIFLGSFFPIFTNTYLGVRSLEQIHVHVAECMGAGRWQFVKEVMFPSALPYMLTGMRIGLGVGWMCVIAAEMIAATSGLGYMIQLARTLIETEKVIAGMIVIGVIGYAMNHLMLYAERKLTPWRERPN